MSSLYIVVTRQQRRHYAVKGFTDVQGVHLEPVTDTSEQLHVHVANAHESCW